MTDFNSRSETSKFIERLKAALKEFEQDESIKITINHRYSFLGSGIKLELSFESDGSESQAEVKFKMYCRTFGLTPEDYGKIITLNNSTYKIVGIAPQAVKYPVLAEKLPSRKCFKLPGNSVLMALGRKPVFEPMFPNVRLPFPQGL